MKLFIIRIILTIPFSRKWSICQLNVNNVFLHGTLYEDVYMEQPLGYYDVQYPSFGSKLRKTLYDLK